MIDDVNKHFQEALTLKSMAIKPNAALDLFRQAAEKFKAAYELINTLISQETDNSDRIRSQVLYHYYCHEEYDCLYAFFLKKNDLGGAQDRVDAALSEISKALNIIEQNLDIVNQSTRTFLIKMKTDWLYRELVTEAKTFEPKAKTKSRKSDFIGALDTYKTMLDKYSLAKDYCLENDLSPELKRISMGNYFGQSVNVSQMYAGHISTIQSGDNSNTDWNVDLLRHFLDSYQLSKKAFDANPEWLEYREGQDIVKGNIESIISSNKDFWETYLIEFDEQPELVKVMKSNDMDRYKKLKAKSDIENNSLKKLYFTGLFWLVLFGVIVFVVFSIFDSSIPILYKPLAVFFIVILFSVVGAFILRTTKELSEEGFLQLMKLSLKIGFKGLKTLDQKPDEAT
jgi:hypothetical protein